MIRFIETQSYGKLPVRVSYSALKQYQLETGKEALSEEGMLDNMFTGELEILLFHALKRGFKLQGKEFTLKKEEMEDVLDECLFEFIKIIPEFFPKGQQEELSNLPKKSKTEKK